MSAKSKQPTIIIAEAGVNHNGSMEMALKLIDAAADAGADWVKFQTFRADALVTAEAKTAAYQKRTTGGDTQFEMLKKLELSADDFRTLAAHAKSRKIGFLSTPFDLESAALLEEIGMTAVKIPSGELTNLPFIRALSRIDLPFVLSTGMATLGEVEAALQTLEDGGLSPERVTILHCTTEYPAPAEEINLKAMNALGAAFPECPVGYSDHSEGHDITVAAVALGATMIEKHFTLDRSLPGPDHKASLEPDELAAMVKAIRRVEAALGDGRKRPTVSEVPNRLVARKSIVAARAIEAGEALSDENLAVKRPGDGIPPSRWDEMLGKAAARAYRAGEKIEI